MATEAKVRGRGPFDDERFVPDKRYSDLCISEWDLLTAAAAELDVKEKGEGRKRKRKIEGKLKIRRKRSRDFEDGDADAAVGTATDKFLKQLAVDEAVDNLLEQLGPLKVWCKADTDKFLLKIEKARSDFRFYDHLRLPALLIQHDSSVESVMEKLSFSWAKFLSRSEIRGNIGDYISVLWKEHYADMCYQYKLFLISALRKEHYTDLYHQYRLAQADRPSFEGDTRISCILAELKNCDAFSENGLDSISPSDLEAGLLDYISFVVDHQRKGRGDDVKARYRERILEMHAHDKAELKKGRKRFPAQFTDPFHFLVFKEREEGYAIQHPVVEIAKFRAYFNNRYFLSMDEEKAQYEALHGNERVVNLMLKIGNNSPESCLTRSVLSS